VANIDPRLTSKLGAALTEEKVRAVITLSTQPMNHAGSAQTTNNIMDEILRRTENATNEKPSRVKYFSKLGVLMIEASTSFIQKLIENPEIATAALAADDDIYKI
jgi:hypothetical protein